MGDEFLERTRPSIVKHIDRMRVALATPDILTIRPSDEPRRSVVSMDPQATLAGGDRIILEARGNNILLVKGNAVVGRFDNPAAELVKAISESGGAAGGTVQRVHKISRKAEISLC